MKLSEEQKRICQAAVDESILVIAAPGSGKTTSVIARIQHLQKKFGVELDKMLYITYSKKLADEVTQKLTAMKLDGLYHANTIDSLCWKLLKRRNDDLDIPPGEIIEQYEQMMERDDELTKPLANISHVFLDEAQDLDSARYEVIKLSFTHASMMIVGDPRQCIYQNLFGANPGLMQLLRPSATVMTLSVSFRLSPHLSTFVNAAFQYAGQTTIIPGNLKSKNVKPILTMLHASNYGDDKGIDRPKVVEHVVARCKKLIGAGRARPKEVAILCPTARSKTSSNLLLNTIRTTLEHAKIPAYFNQREYDSPCCTSRQEKNRVYIGTAHSSKGAEWDHVILLNFFIAPGAFMREFDGIENKDFKNLLFVACTRARESLEMIESCYYASKNERVDFIRKLDSEISLNNISVQKLGKLGVTGTRPSNPGVTEILHTMTVPQSKALAAITAKSEVAKGPESNYKHPRVFTENSDSTIYGKFIELVIVRKLAEKTPQFVDICRQIGTMPLYITDQELRDVIMDNPKIDPFKFEFSEMDLNTLQDIVRKEKSKKGKFKKSDLEARLKVSGCYVLKESNIFYDKLGELSGDVRDMRDTERSTHDVIDAIWEVTLLKLFHETNLGVYWLKPWHQSAKDLLPVGASGWKTYLDCVENAFQSLELQMRATQLLLVSGKLLGSADIVCEDETVIDIKCTMDESQAAGAINCAQIQCYRGMLQDGFASKPGLIFSAMTCAFYRVPKVDDSIVLNYVKDIESMI